MTVTFREPRYYDVKRIGRRVRAIDRLECWAMGKGPRQALRQGIEASALCWTAEIDGIPAAAFGVVPISLINGWGVPWLLGTDRAVEAQREFLTLAPQYLARIEAIFPRLENYTHQRNHQSIRWLRRLGFVVDPDPVHFSGEPMLHFHKGF